jgi:2',3'-cyclic-nucleotide 2'-phosphodiesterase (5'-nucleotidase family)
MRDRYYVKGSTYSKQKVFGEVVAYIMDGYSQKQAAELAGITEKTVCAWMKESPEVKAKIDAYKAGEIKNPFDADDSLTVFLAWSRVNAPNDYPTIVATGKKFAEHLTVITTRQRKRLEALFMSARFPYTAFEAIRTVTNNRKSAIALLSKPEADEVLAYLQNIPATEKQHRRIDQLYKCLKTATPLCDMINTATRHHNSKTDPLNAVGAADIINYLNRL